MGKLKLKEPRICIICKKEFVPHSKLVWVCSDPECREYYQSIAGKQYIRDELRYLREIGVIDSES